jgi:hypothetical protein
VALIDQIRPLINIQKEENWHNLRTYVIYIDMFPHVLEDKYFAGHKVENMGNIVKIRNQESIKVDSTQTNEENAHSPEDLGLKRTRPRPRPNKRSTRVRRWRGGPARGRAHQGCGCTPNYATWA